MSPNPYPLFLVARADKPEKIKVKIGMLTRLYLKHPDGFIAKAIENHIAALLVCPKYINDIEQRCQLRRLEKHWRCLAWIDV